MCSLRSLCSLALNYIGYSLRITTVSVATYPLTMRSIRGGTLGWNIEIYSTPTNQFDWSVSRAYVINIYIYGHQPDYTRKMVPITGQASASFSSMLKLKRIGNE